jgi:hypothetical protein
MHQSNWDYFFLSDLGQEGHRDPLEADIKALQCQKKAKPSLDKRDGDPPAGLGQDV